MLVMRLMGIHMPLSSIAWNIIEVSGSTEWKMGYMYTHVFAGFITRTSNYLRMHNVDNTQNIISFCTGYGGLELGIRRAGVDVRTVCNVEIETFCCANLVAKTEEGRMDNAPIWTDLKTFPAREFRGKICGLIGGYPCQPFSSAGKRQGEKDPRHLWPYLLKHVRAIRPVWCFWENVAGHTTMGLWRVLSDLEEEGYRCAWGIFSAEEVGAPHQRKRVFILGYSTSLRPHRGSENCEGEQSEVLGERLESDAELANPTNMRREQTQRQGRQDFRRGSKDRCRHTREGQDTSGGSEEELADSERCGSAESMQLDTDLSAKPSGCDKEEGQELGHTQWPARPGEEQYEWEEPRVVGNTDNGRRTSCKHSRSSKEKVGGGEEDTKQADNRQAQSFMGGATHGTQHRVDRLRLLGNGVVPQTAELAWRTLWKEMDNGN